MNFSTAIFLINKDVRAVRVSYEQDALGKGVAPFYMFKTLDPEVTVGDYVVIPTNTRHNLTVARVEEIVPRDDVEFDNDIQLKWLIDRVDSAAAKHVEAQEAEAITRIKSAEARAKRDELARKLLNDNPDLASLDIVNTPPALPAA